MELRRLRYFTVVAEELHVGRAAQRLYMAQQPLSQQIRELERELGCDLFERAANRIRLTPAGMVLLDEARAILARVDSASEATRRAARGEIGTVRVGYCSTAMGMLPPVIRDLKERHPNLGVTLREMSQARQFAALERDELDVGFVYGPFDERAFASIPVHDDAFVVALASGDRLATADVISPSALIEQPRIALAAAEYRSMHQFSEDALRVDGRVPSVAFEVGDRASALALVASKMGFAVLPRRTTLTYPGVVYRPLDSDVRLQFVAVWSRQVASSLVRQRFIDALRPRAEPEAEAS